MCANKYIKIISIWLRLAQMENINTIQIIKSTVTNKRKKKVKINQKFVIFFDIIICKSIQILCPFKK